MIELLLASQSQDFVRIQTLELEAGQRADVATLADLDGDGVREVLLALHEPGKKFARRLETWRASQGGELTRSESLALTPDVVAFAHADVRAGGTRMWMYWEKPRYHQNTNMPSRPKTTPSSTGSGTGFTGRRGAGSVLPGARGRAR